MFMFNDTSNSILCCQIALFCNSLFCNSVCLFQEQMSLAVFKLSHIYGRSKYFMWATYNPSVILSLASKTSLVFIKGIGSCFSE